MSRRLRVLISAYACAPHKGTEPEVGWPWGLQMARFHEVTVLTQTKNRPVIESALNGLGPGQPQPGFVYHGFSRWFQRFKQFPLGLRLYYILWQRSAREVIKGLCREESFDLL